MLTAIGSWPTLLIALVIYGFAPGAVLRIIVRAFHRDDPRREELLAELHVVPRLERPFWVFEQLEVALFEGVWGRIAWAATGRIFHRWRLDSGVSLHRAHPETFWIPSDRDKSSVRPGTHVKLIFSMRDGWGERMWVDVVAVKGRCIVGILRNQPCGIPRLQAGDQIRFTADHIIDIDIEDDSARSGLASS